MSNENLAISLNGNPFELNRSNTVLYTFIGSAATYNHVFIITDERESVANGVYIWETFYSSVYSRIKAHIEEHRYPQYINLNDVSTTDAAIFEKAVRRNMSDLGDFVPDDFDK